MKHLLVLAVLMAGCIAPQQKFRNPYPVGDIGIAHPEVAGIVDVTVRVLTYNEGGAGTGSGSGVFITPTIVLTCAHVTEKAHSVRVDQGVYNRDALVVKENRELALALLYVEGNHGAAKLAIINPLLYQPCILVGYQMGLESPTVTDGRIQELDCEGSMRFSSASYFGASGGGIFIKRSGQWELVGICQRIYMHHNLAPVYHQSLGSRLIDLATFLKAD